MNRWLAVTLRNFAVVLWFAVLFVLVIAMIVALCTGNILIVIGGLMACAMWAAVASCGLDFIDNGGTEKIEKWIAEWRDKHVGR